MASRSALKRRTLNLAAFATALAIHLAWLLLLIGVAPTFRQPPLWQRDYPLPPYDVTLMPRRGAGSANAAGAVGRPVPRSGPGARTPQPAPEPESVEGAAHPQDAPSQASPPPQLAPAPPPLQISPPVAVSASAPTPELRPVQSPSMLVPDVRLPTLAPVAPSLQIDSPAAAPVRAPVPELRPSPSLALPVPEAEPRPVLADRAPPLQIDRPPTVTGAAPAPVLQPLPSLAIAAPEPSPAPVLAPPSAPLQIDRPGTVTRRAAVPELRPAPSLGDGALQAASPAAPGPAVAAPGLPGDAPGRAQAVAGAAGNSPHPGCAPEVLMLLTPEEKVRCRNEIEAAAARRASQNAAADRARRVEEARTAAWIDGIPPEKRAYYDAVAAARNSVRNVEMGGKSAAMVCNLGGLFGGKSTPPAGAIKLPGLPCAILPPVGFLTEESRISPP